MSHCIEEFSSLSLQNVFSGFLLLDEQVLTTTDFPENKSKSPFHLWSLIWHGHLARLFCRQGELEESSSDGRLLSYNSMLAAFSKIKLSFCVINSFYYYLIMLNRF